MNRFQEFLLSLDFAAGNLGEECQHPRTELRARTISNGAVQIVPQCLDCGRACGNPVPRRAVKGSPAPFDVALAKPKDYAAERCERRRAFFEWYDAYLASPEWKERRLKVLSRDKGICQGCAKPASEVHHLTYDHVGEEFLFELIAVCHDCHTRLHKDSEVPING